MKDDILKAAAVIKSDWWDGLFGAWLIIFALFNPRFMKDQAGSDQRDLAALTEARPPSATLKVAVPELGIYPGSPDQLS